jgi:hypothetical protein
VSVESIVVEALKTKIPELAHGEEFTLEIIQENAYHLHTHPPYFVKYIADGDRLGRNEIWANQTIMPEATIPRPTLVFTVKTVDATIICWEWLDGIDLRYQQRNLLPQAFEQLGYFHAQQRHTNPVSSLVTHGTYDTLKDLLEAELAFLTRYHAEAVRQEVMTAFTLLETGFATYLHGDLHPGNIRITEQGLKFVDWGYCTSSLCFFDLGYIQTINFDDPEEDNHWWCITPEEAQLVLPAYYKACGLGGYDYFHIHRAVMLWSKLWAYHNCIKNGDEFSAEKCRKHIARLIALK